MNAGEKHGIQGGRGAVCEFHYTKIWRTLQPIIPHSSQIESGNGAMPKRILLTWTVPPNKTKAGFIEPMLLLPTSALPEGDAWVYELKLDGYRAIVFKTNGHAQLRSRNDKDFSRRYPGIAEALSTLPNETVVDGEVVALDDSGQPSFNLLQNFGSSAVPVFYYVFDVLVFSGRNVMGEPLRERRKLLQRHILPRLEEPIRECPRLDASLDEVIAAVRAQGLEGVVAKSLNSLYEPGRRSGVWRKMRINKGQEFVIGGYTLGAKYFDAVIFGYYQDGKLLYAGRTRNGFTPMLREQLQKHLRGLEIPECPFANLPEKRPGRWGLGLTAQKMKECRWLKPELVANFEYVEWTPDRHLRHSRFVALREDKDARSVRLEW
jgi:DNA ligase D-like protein (predicted ligase)